MMSRDKDQNQKRRNRLERRQSKRVLQSEKLAVRELMAGDLSVDYGPQLFAQALDAQAAEVRRVQVAAPITGDFNALPSIEEPQQTGGGRRIAFKIDGSEDIHKLTLNGTAKKLNGEDVRYGENAVLLTNGKWQVASAFISQPIVSLTNSPEFGFSTHFEAQIAQTSKNHGDGFAFVLASDPNALGIGGGGIGYGGLQKSIAVEFDTWRNRSWDGKSNTHVGINLAGELKSTARAELPFEVHDQEVSTFHVWLDFHTQRGTLEVRVAESEDRPAEPLLSHQITLEEIFSDEDLFVGFTSATGGASGEHAIRSWDFAADLTHNAGGENSQTYAIAEHKVVSVGGKKGPKTFEWVSPGSGLVTLRGSVWNAFTADEFADSWTIRHNGKAISTGTLVTEDSGEDAGRSLVLGSGGIGSLTNIPVELGDKFSITLSSEASDELGLNFRVRHNATGIPEFEIGAIPDQVFHSGETTRFYVVPSGNGTISIETLGDTKGNLSFDSGSGLVEYNPGEKDLFPLHISLKDSSEGLEQIVRLAPPAPQPEFDVIGDANRLPDPRSSDYVTISEREVKRSNFFFNGQRRESSKSIEISGKTIVLRPGHKNGLFERLVSTSSSRNANVTDLTLKAETIVIAGHARFPGTNVAIHAKRLRLVDSHGSAIIDTTPHHWETAAKQFNDGRTGQNAGALELNLGKLVLPTTKSNTKRFILVGGNGQAAGQGRPGDDGSPKHIKFCSPTKNDFKGTKTPFPIKNWPEWPFVVYAYRMHEGKEIPLCGSRSLVPTNGGDVSEEFEGGRPGDGGSGGKLTTSVGLALELVDQRGGRAGTPAKDQPGGMPGGLPLIPHLVVEVKTVTKMIRWSEARVVESHVPLPGKGWKAPSASGGKSGTTSISNVGQSPNWLRAGSMQAMVEFAKDAYLGGNIGFAAQEFARLSQLIESAKPFNAKDSARLEMLQVEVATLANQASQQRDYFGKPLGWAPSFSFAANHQAYESEIDADISTLFLSQFAQRHADQSRKKIQLIEAAFKQLDTNIDLAVSSFNDAQLLLPELESHLRSIESETAVVENQMKELEKRLYEQAKDIVEPRRAWWQKAFGIMGSVLQAVPHPIVAGIGTAVSVGTNLATELVDGDWLGAASNLDGLVNPFSEKSLKATSKEIDEQLKLLKPPSSASVSDISGFVGNLAKLGKKYAPVVKTLMDEIKGKEVPTSEIEKQLAKLKETDPDFVEVVDALAELSAKKSVFATKLTETLSEISDALGRVSSAYSVADALHQERISASEGLLPETLETLKKMGRGASDRLMKHKYFLAKSFEYEFLESYEGELHPERLMDSISKQVAESDDPKWLNDPEYFDSLKSLFKDELQEVASQIWTRLNESAPRLTTNVSLRLSAEQLAQFNRNDEIELNLVDLGIVDSSWEDARLLGAQVIDVSSEVSGTPQSANVRFEFGQPAASILQKNGETFRFVHSAAAVGDAIWASDYDALRGDKPVAATVSPRELAAIGEVLDLDFTSIDSDFAARLYASPSARSTLKLTKYDIGAPHNTSIDLEEVWLSFRLDFQRPRDSMAVLEIVVDDGIQPWFEMSNEDISGRSHGLGSITRYFEQGESLSVHAQPTLGTMRFVEWQDLDGTSLSEAPELELSMGNDVRVQAVYVSERQGQQRPGTRMSEDSDPVSENKVHSSKKKTPLPYPTNSDREDPLDVNGDGFISWLDAMAVINALNSDSEKEEDDTALDANSDGRISAIDALLVVNHLNSSLPAAEEESSASNESLIDGYFCGFDKEKHLFGLDLFE